MRFLKTLFNRSINTNRRSLNKRTKTLSLESLEQRIALDASGVRPQLEPVREVHIDNSLAGPDPMVFGKSELVGYDTKSFVITHVAAGSTVEKWDAATNQWRDVSTPPTSSNPRQLLQLLQNRIIQKDDQVRWIPKSTAGVTQKAFEIIGWDDGSETSEPEGVNVPGAVENLEIDIVGDQVQVTWDPPTTGAAVTHYRIHQNPTTVVPSTQTSHTFAKVASPASYAVTVHANSAEGAGEAMTVTLSTGSYVKNDGTVVDPILDTSGNVLDYDGPNLKADANLFRATLTDANLTNADLKRANLIAANLQGANLVGADLTEATLAFVQSGGLITNGSTRLPMDWQLMDGYLIGPGANLTDADLTGHDLSGADLTRANLFNAKLDGATLSNAILLNVDLSTVATLTNVKSGGITGPLWDSPTDWKLIDGYLIGPTADLTGADLSGMDLSGMDLSGADLSGADLSNVKSGDITGDGSTTLPTNWQLIDGYLIGPSADLTGANLSGADLTGADLTNVKSGGITGVPHALPTNWQLTDGYLIGPGADLAGANLSGALLNNAVLTGANLSGANLSGTDLTGVTLFGVQSGGITGTPHALPTAGPYGNVQWQLIDGYLIGPGADLTGASLTDSNLNNTSLVGANLTNAQLNGAHLDNADLYNATLTGVQSGAITGTIKFLPADWRITTNGYLIGPSANLTNADLSNADLNNLDLSNATLTGVRSGGITGVPYALPTNWQLTDGHLIGPGANLSGANLTGANLSGANLSGANLTGAHLQSATLPANLPGTDLRGANLSYAYLQYPIIYGTGGAKYNHETTFLLNIVMWDATSIYPPGEFDPVLAGWTLVS